MYSGLTLICLFSHLLLKQNGILLLFSHGRTVFVFSGTSQSIGSWPNSFCQTSSIKCSKFLPLSAFVFRSLFGVNKLEQELTCSGKGKPPPLDPSKVCKSNPEKINGLLVRTWVES